MIHAIIYFAQNTAQDEGIDKNMFGIHQGMAKCLWVKLPKGHC